METPFYAWSLMDLWSWAGNLPYVGAIAAGLFVLWFVLKIINELGVDHFEAEDRLRKYRHEQEEAEREAQRVDYEAERNERWHLEVLERLGWILEAVRPGGIHDLD